MEQNFQSYPHEFKNHFNKNKTPNPNSNIKSTQNESFQLTHSIINSNIISLKVQHRIRPSHCDEVLFNFQAYFEIIYNLCSPFKYGLHCASLCDVDFVFKRERGRSGGTIQVDSTYRFIRLWPKIFFQLYHTFSIWSVPIGSKIKTGSKFRFPLS